MFFLAFETWHETYNGSVLPRCTLLAMLFATDSYEQCCTLLMKVLHKFYKTITHGLPHMSSHKGPQASGVHIRQTTHACVTTIKCTPSWRVLQFWCTLSTSHHYMPCSVTSFERLNCCWAQYLRYASHPFYVSVIYILKFHCLEISVSIFGKCLGR